MKQHHDAGHAPGTNFESRKDVPTPAAKAARRAAGFGIAALVAAVALQLNGSFAAESVTKIPPPTMDQAATTAGPQTAVFAGGCFWGVQGVFQHTKGVLQAVSGYAGGAKDTAAYEMVGTGSTGHAESVQVSFDPKQVTYGQLLQIYFSVAHDPTQLNRQGPDHGTQYRSAIFYTSADQKQVAEHYIAQLDGTHAYHGKIVTQLTPLAGFYAAEGYHQDYATLHPDSGYIATFDLPKIAALKSLLPERYRETPVLVSQASK